MADLDEHPPPPSHPLHSSTSLPSPPFDDDDNDDDTPLTYQHLAPSAALPRRGTKDFESHGTNAQISVLESSRQTMHEALSVGRTHTAKSSLVGYFNYGNWQARDDVGGEQERERSGERPVVVERPTGQHIRTMGKADREGRLWLLPEEVVYLVERGSLDVRYRDLTETAEEGEGEVGGEDGKDNEEGEWRGGGWNDVSMSLQACYAWFIGRDGLDLERYSVFAGLRRSGYIVLRAPGWNEDDNHQTALITQVRYQSPKEEPWNVWQWLYKNLLERKPQNAPPLGPLVGPGLYRSYSICLLLSFPSSAHVLI